MTHPVDHTKFIEKHDVKARLFKDLNKPNPYESFFLVGLFALYVGIFLFTLLSLNVDANLIFLVGGMVSGFFVLTYVLYRAFYWRKREQKLALLLQRMFEGSHSARLITDIQGNTFFYNNNFSDLIRSSGSEEACESIRCVSRLFEENTEAMENFGLLMDQAARGMSNNVELFTILNGEEKTFEIAMQMIPDFPGYIHWRIDDVSQRREIDLSIREEREKLIDFTDNAPVGFFSVNEVGRFVFVNATFARWVGEDISTLLETGRLHTYISNLPPHLAPYDIKKDGGMRQIAEVTMKGPGGKTFFAGINQTVVRDEDGRVRTRAVVNDLTTERSMRLALKASEDKFQRFFNEAPLGIAIVSPEGRIENYNTAFGQMLGISDGAKDGLGSLKDLLSADDLAVVLPQLKKLHQEERMSVPIDVSLSVKNQEPVVVQLYGRKFRDSENIVLHFLDVTQQKVLEEQFAQSQKMQAIGQLAGGIAHDFNNLLTAMTGFCDLLLLRHKPGDPSFSDIMQIKQNSNRAANLVRQLLAFSRQQTLQPKVHDITDILTELSHLLRRLIGANIDLDVSHGQNLGLVKVDEGQMEQVLINLAVNARDAMQASGGGHLTIRTFAYENKKSRDLWEEEMPPGKWTAIEVRDTGCGIPEENLSRVLEPFFTTKDVGQGTGLGLATVYGIIRQTGGYLDVESQVGVGTAFTIYLPCVAAPEREEDIFEDDVALQSTQPKDLTGTACILLVEDEDAVRTFSTRALSNKGYEVLAAESGEHALKIMTGKDDKPIDLLISDVVMPNMDGPTLAQRLRQDNPKLKIIFISGYTEDRLKDHLGDNISFLPKPFTLKQLAEKVKDVLDG